MRLYLVRHAEAAPGEPDELRPLTRDGREQARALGERLRDEDARRTRSSRARCCAHARRAASSRGRSGSRPSPTSGWRPGRRVDDVRAAVAGRGERVVVVGHQPDCGQIAAALTGGPSPRSRQAASPCSSSTDGWRNVRRRRPGPAQVATATTRRCAASSFEIAAGEVFGLLGPNGAGKTTTVEILEGYRQRDGGTVTGARRGSRQRAGQRWRERIGVVLQSSAMYQNMTVAREPRALRRLLPSSRGTSTR